MRFIRSARGLLPSLAFFGGAVAQTVGVVLIYLPAGLIFGGLLATGCAVLWTVNGPRRRRP